MARYGIALVLVIGILSSWTSPIAAPSLNASSNWPGWSLPGWVPVAQVPYTDDLGDNVGDVLFVNRLDGWALSGGRVLATHDGGITWDVFSVPSVEPLQHITFADDRNGYAVAAEEQLWQTHDGGVTWHRINIRSSTYPALESIVAPTPTVLYGFNPSSTSSIDRIDNAGTLYRSRDGGRTWQMILDSSRSSLYTSVVSADDIWALKKVYQESNGAVRAVDSILHSMDGGNHWTALPLSVTSTSAAPSGMQGIAFTDSSSGYVFGGTYVAHTSDGGHNWSGVDLVGSTKVVTVSVGGVSGFQGTPSYHPHAVVEGRLGLIDSVAGLYETTNGGGTWFRSTPSLLYQGRSHTGFRGSIPYMVALNVMMRIAPYSRSPILPFDFHVQVLTPHVSRPGFFHALVETPPGSQLVVADLYIPAATSYGGVAVTNDLTVRQLRQGYWDVRVRVPNYKLLMAGPGKFGFLIQRGAQQKVGSVRFSVD